MINSQELFLKRIAADKSAHFYLISPKFNAAKSSKLLLQWCDKLVRNLIKSSDKRLSSGRGLNDHPDILLIDDERVKKNFYDKSIISSIDKFFRTKALQLPKKILIFHDLSFLSENQQNKLLKLLEDPPLDALIIALNPRLSKILDTVASRAQHLKVSLVSDTDTGLSLKEWSDKLGDKHLSQFLDYFKKKQDQEQEFARTLLDAAMRSNHPCVALDSYLKTSTEDATYNHSNFERLTLLYRAFNELKALLTD